MSDAAVAACGRLAPAVFDDLDRALRDTGPAAALARLENELEARGQYRALLDAMLLRARHELGLPLLHSGSLADAPEPVRSQYEERYVAAIRTVGGRFLDAGDIAAAWPYFRAIGEPEPVARAIDAYQPADSDERLAAIIEVAFNHGAHPRKGFELILEHYGTCSAITAFEQLPQDESVRAACAGALVRRMHHDLVANLRADLAQRGFAPPPEGASMAELLAGQDTIFDDESYHIDVSHLASTVRVAPLLSDPAALRLAVELTDYGRRLSPRLVYEGDPPFESVYEDHGVYLRALIGQDVDAALTHFRAKLSAAPATGLPGLPERGPGSVGAQVLVGLLARVGRLEEAIDVAGEHLASYPDAALFCPGVAQLCQRAGRPDRLARIAGEDDDLVNYAAAIVALAATPAQDVRS